MVEQSVVFTHPPAGQFIPRFQRSKSRGWFQAAEFETVGPNSNGQFGHLVAPPWAVVESGSIFWSPYLNCDWGARWGDDGSHKSRKALGVWSSGLIRVASMLANPPNALLSAPQTSASRPPAEACGKKEPDKPMGSSVKKAFKLKPVAHQRQFNCILLRQYLSILNLLTAICLLLTTQSR